MTKRHQFIVIENSLPQMNWRRTIDEWKPLFHDFVGKATVVFSFQMEIREIRKPLFFIHEFHNFFYYSFQREMRPFFS